ncbi:MAG: hypothetical protein ABS36_15330 [Acidobacteria bacterium SCN 69-37]|nr:MAG: hypothetical protein ABS36_15330 [Acidobacteria bacterium SCN 69-37]
MRYSRREVGKLALAGLVLPRLAGAALFQGAAPRGPVPGVRVGAVTYSFRSMTDARDIVAGMRKLGFTEAELMNNHAEALAGAPAPPPLGGGRGRGRGSLTPEQIAEFQAAQRAAQEAATAWRKTAMAAVASTFAPVRQAFADAGIGITYLVYNFNVKTTSDEELEYAFQMAKALGAVGITTSTTVAMANRLAPFADRHELMVGFHGHSNLTDPEQIATPASFAACIAPSKFHMINLDIGHFAAANFDPVAFLKEQRPRVMSLHIKDRRRDNGANTPFGEGDTPVREVLQLLKQNPSWNIPGNIEFEYPGDPMVEIPKCLDYCRAAVA